jgi:phospholipase/carboxylesterase
MDRGNPALSARPGEPIFPAPRGWTQVGLGSGRDGLLYIPESYSGRQPAPLFVALHGASGRGNWWLWLSRLADQHGMILLAPDSRDRTWDRLLGRFDADVEFIDRALRHTFQRCRIDASRLALGGFSDGASYALSLGIPNGGLFSHLVAFSPGTMAVDMGHVGSPRVFVSHGTTDTVLPVWLSRDSIVPHLRGSGYDVTYRQFSGRHEIPQEIAAEALEWFVDGDQPAT